jgi:hypothetical protein
MTQGKKKIRGGQLYLPGYQPPATTITQTPSQSQPVSTPVQAPTPTQSAPAQSAPTQPSDSVNPDFEKQVANAPDFLPKEQISDYVKRTGITNGGVILRKFYQRQQEWIDSEAFKKLVAMYAQLQTDFDNSNKDTPENRARQAAVGRAFKGSLGDQMYYKVAQTAKGYIDIGTNVVGKVLDFIPGVDDVVGTVFNGCAKGLDALYNYLNIPEDTSNEASAARVVAAVKAVQAQYGEGFSKKKKKVQKGKGALNSDDMNNLDLLFQDPNLNQKPSDIIRNQSFVNDMKLDTQRQMKGLALKSTPLTPYADLSNAMVEKLDNLYALRLAIPQVMIAIKGDPGLRQYRFNQINSLIPPPVPSQLIPQWKQQGMGLTEEQKQNVVDSRGKSKIRRKEIIENMKEKLQKPPRYEGGRLHYLDSILKRRKKKIQGN